MNLQESIKKILRESLESEWNEGNYNYQHGFCHYFAYNIIDKIRERFPKKKVNYYLLLANEVNKDTDEVEQDYLLHVYIKIGDKLLDSNGLTTMDEVEQRVNDWYNRQLTMTPEEYDINVWEEESDEIPEMFFNNRFCNTKRVKEDMGKFLSNPSVQKLLKDTLNESIPPQVRRRQEEFDRIFLHYRDSFIGHEYRVFKSFWNLLMESSLETLYHTLFKKTVSDDDWEESAEYIENYLIKKYKDETKQMWEKKNPEKLNESKSSNRLNILNDLVEPFKEDVGICDIDIWYDDIDDMYLVYLVFGTEELNNNLNSDGKFLYIKKKQKQVRDTIKGFFPIENIYVGSYGRPNCEWSPLNESEDNEKKKIQKNLKAIRTLLDTIDVDGLCEMWVEYNPEDGDYEIRSKTTRKYLDMADMVRELKYIDDTIRSWGMKTYVYTPWYVENCEDEVEFLNESETKTNSSLHKLLNVLFDGFDNADYDWANYMCGMGECCDQYAIGFTLPDSDYDDYIFKLVDGEMYDDDGDYPEEFRNELPEPCYQQPDIKDPKFDTIVFYGLYAEEIEDYMGHAHNWNLDLLKIINNQFGCDAKEIVII